MTPWFPLPALSVRLATLAACARNLLAIVAGEGAPIALYPTVCRDAEFAFQRAAIVCPTSAVALLADLTNNERALLASVVAFPPMWTSSNESRRAMAEPFLPELQKVRSGRRWDAPIDNTVSA